jgi:putative transposase
MDTLAARTHEVLSGLPCQIRIHAQGLKRPFGEVVWLLVVGMGVKAVRHGRQFVKIGRFEPTSRVCSAYGVKDGPKPLSVREWTCRGCGTVHDRDVNAARNVATAGRAGALNACGGDVRQGSALAVAGETGTLRGAA